MAVALSVEMLLFSSLFLLPISVISQNDGSVPVESSLTATTGDSSSYSWRSPSGDFAFGFSPLGNHLFLLSIWYAKIQGKTVVWYAYDRNNNPIVASGGSVLKLTTKSGLVLNNPQGGEIWKSRTTSGIVANGFMNDTGNFVLQDKNSGSLWETFSNPTDTVLPGQTIERNGNLSCRQSETNYTKGRFQLQLQPDGNLVLSTVNLTTGANIICFSMNTTNGTVEGSPGKQLVFTSSGDMFVLRENDGKVPLTGTEGVSVKDNYIRATLDFDGIFALYSHPKSCTGIASWSRMWYMPDKCRIGFPKDIYGGCKRVESAHKWVWIGISIAAALVLCTAYYLLRRRSALASAGENEMPILVEYNGPTDDVNGLQNDGTIGHHDLSEFSYASILAATSNFAEENKLGEEGFEPVYKGKLENGPEIAVKWLSKSSGLGNSEFKKELRLIHEFQRTNLVQLFGFCFHEEEWMLIYEYMPNKSLDYFIFDSTRDEQLDWKKRFGIIKGITKGLLCLQRHSRMRVIYGDLKARNILIDENMNPKIAYFGLARIFTHTELEASTSRIVGTVPETIEGIVPVKTIFYDLGVLILEIISGLKINRVGSDDGLPNSVGYAWGLWKQKAGLELMDPTLGDSCNKKQLLRCIHIGLLCVEENVADQLPMLDVLSMLTNESMELREPKKPA